VGGCLVLTPELDHVRLGPRRLLCAHRDVEEHGEGCQPPVHCHRPERVRHLDNPFSAGPAESGGLVLLLPRLGLVLRRGAPTGYSPFRSFLHDTPPRTTRRSCAASGSRSTTVA